jgi:hypothetical protein
LYVRNGDEVWYRRRTLYCSKAWLAGSMHPQVFILLDQFRYIAIANYFAKLNSNSEIFFNIFFLWVGKKGL